MAIMFRKSVAANSFETFAAAPNQREPGRCIISNWHTTDACFLSKKLQIKNAAGMAAACVAVLLIAFMLEGLRRAVKEYDRHLVRRHLRKKYRIKTGKRSVARGMDISLGNAAGFAVVDRPLSLPKYRVLSTGDEGTRQSTTQTQPQIAVPVTSAPAQMDGASSSRQRIVGVGSSAKMEPVRYRPSLGEQLARTLLMTLTFVLAYLLMLLGMYYNGFILISIFVGVFLGIFAFTWGHLGGGGHKHDMPSSMGEITLCCG
ncbi:Ctr copper transporter family-domain-containing protein [Cladorrhinum samala]|uniref:Copper transport protein n=1 Tax=Cladorrhinum samala TaxID=585594 RepID=A0AAV9I1C8_9PEZI|nr:Ctr copper transporter family-domain-containing protein [Cladorrhinum samala]